MASRPEVAAGWSAPSALEGLTVGAVVAHLVLATERTATVLEAEPPSGDEVRAVGLADFYGPNRIDDRASLEDGLPAFVRDSAAAKSEAGPEAVVAELAALGPRLRPLLESAPADRIVPVVQVRGGAASLDDYLVTRVIELVVHTDDLACSVGLELPDPPAEVLAVAGAAFVELAAARAGGRAVVRAFTRGERADPEVLRVL